MDFVELRYFAAMYKKPHLCHILRLREAFEKELSFQFNGANYLSFGL